MAKTTKDPKTTKEKKTAASTASKETKSVKKPAAAKAAEYKLDPVAQTVLDNFSKVSSIPRGSGNEEGIRNFLVQWAKDNKFRSIVDKTGNIIIKIPADKGLESRNTITLQGHMDMVCEKGPDSKHDFTKDPIEFVYDGEWLRANDTTLGADDGIGIALAMTLATDKSLKHGPLEMVFTVEEETGLVGANGLAPDMIDGKYLINIDSENENVFTVGCAGGKTTNIEMDLAYEEVPDNYIALQLVVSKLTGGHSGENIGEERANAIKVINRIISGFREVCDVRLAWYKGGSAHNAIPRNAESVFYIPEDRVHEIFEIGEQFEKALKAEYSFTDPNMSIEMEELPLTTDRRAMMGHITERVLSLVSAMRHGVASRCPELLSAVETSSNLASIGVEGGKFLMQTSQRSYIVSRIEAISKRIETIARLAGARVSSYDGYSPWTPDFDSELLARCKQVHEKLFGMAPEVKPIHAGLECGIIGNLKPDMQMISVGPGLKNPHSTAEKLYLPSIKKIYSLISGFIDVLE